MKKMLGKVRGRLGDFWWYSLVLFCAARAADALNAFVGLWLVPKYVDPTELGAVMPLANFANFLALPAAVFANTFRNELTRLSAACEYGKMKTLMKGVFAASAIFLLAALVASRLLLPVLLERIRIVEGSLGFLILVSSFLATIHPVFGNALQSLKKFNASAMIGIACAPVRFLTMLVAMPFRALSGYFAGAAASPAFNIAASLFCLRKELAVPAEPYWTRGVVRRFSRLMALFAVSGAASCICGLVESTVLRQRLPDLDSAGYYMATRFSEIAGFLTGTLSFTLFPFAADLHAKGGSANALVCRSLAAIFVFGSLLALPFFFFGERLLAMLPHGGEYAAYWSAIPWLIGISLLGSVAALYTTSEIAAGRFGFLKWMVPLDLGYPMLLLVVTGWGYFAPYAPGALDRFFAAHNVRTLDTMLWWMTANNAIRAVICAVSMARGRRGRCAGA